MLFLFHCYEETEAVLIQFSKKKKRKKDLQNIVRGEVTIGNIPLNFIFTERFFVFNIQQAAAPSNFILDHLIETTHSACIKSSVYSMP